jgi:endoribonuclease Dicer
MVTVSAATIIDSTSLSLRDYQRLVVDESLKRNTLAVLPTGSGKTLIATHIIKERLQQMKERGTGKKLIAFLAPTKILCGQQQRYLELHLKESAVTVISFTGETSTISGKSINYWNENGWREVFLDIDVLVMTPQICKQMLQRRFFLIDDFDCIVVDEAHHCRLVLLNVFISILSLPICFPFSSSLFRPPP